MKTLRALARSAMAGLPVAITCFYGLLVSSPAGEPTGKLVVAPDQRVELAAVLARLAGDPTAAWPNTAPGLRRFESQTSHAAVVRVRAWLKAGTTPEKLASLLLSRSWPNLDALQSPKSAGSEEGSRTFDFAAMDLEPSAVDLLMAETRDFAMAVDFQGLWKDIEPGLDARAREIAEDPTLSHLTARLTEFFGEPSVKRPAIIPTCYGPWKAPFAAPTSEEGEILVIDRASGSGRLTPETSLSWICVKEFARPKIEELAQRHAERIQGLSGYWSYFKQGIAATSTTGWEDCLNSHLYRAIDLRVRPQEDSVERELRISAALQAGMGMIRVIDAAMTGFDRSRGFYSRFTDYYPTLLEEMVGLEARVRVQRPRLGIKVSPAAAGSTAPTGHTATTGLRIEEILKGHSAEKSDLKVGDVILEANARPVHREETLAQIVQSHSLGDTLSFTVQREGKELPIGVALTKGRVEYEFFRPEAMKDAPAQGLSPGSGK